MKQWMVGAVALVWAGGLATMAGAATIGFEDGLVHVGGTSSVNASGVHLQDGRIDAVGLIGVSAYDITGTCGGYGCLEIQTGAFVGQVAGNPNAFRYAGGGTLSITGTVVTPLTIDPSGVLFSALFDATQDVILQFDTDGFGGRLDTATLQGTLGDGSVETSLASLLGISPLTLTGLSNHFVTSLRVTVGPNGIPVGGGSVERNDIRAETEFPSPNVPVPEPGSLLLLGAGLIGGARVFGRRRER